MKKVKVFLLTVFVVVFTITGLIAAKAAELREPARPEMMAVDGGKLYILDGVEVHIYAMTDYRFLGKFGKTGDGPGEFQSSFANRMQLQVHDGNVLLNNINKMAWFSPEGNLIREIRFPFLVIQVVPVGKNFAVLRFLPGQNGVNQLAVQLVDEQLKTIKTLYTREEVDFRKSGKLDCPNEQIFTRYAENRIYIMDQKGGFLIRVFDGKGNTLPAIEKDEPPLEMPESYKKEVLEWVDAEKSQLRVHGERMGMSLDQMKQMIYYHPYVPAARFFTTNGDTLIVETFVKKDNRSQFIIMDKMGKILKKVFLVDAEPGRVKMVPAATYTFYGNKHIFLTDNPDTEMWEIHVEVF